MQEVVHETVNYPDEFFERGYTRAFGRKGSYSGIEGNESAACSGNGSPVVHDKISKRHKMNYLLGLASLRSFYIPADGATGAGATAADAPAGLGSGAGAGAGPWSPIF